MIEDGRGRWCFQPKLSSRIGEFDDIKASVRGTNSDVLPDVCPRFSSRIKSAAATLPSLNSRPGAPHTPESKVQFRRARKIRLRHCASFLGWSLLAPKGCGRFGFDPVSLPRMCQPLFSHTSTSIYIAKAFLTAAN